ncbi:cytochrome P450 307a1-like [Oratosquilla oratoria]|uniref:cytochrome P450 307a1-like n=1 Tax=Oratosquilla oratoria TaxID=337810 RepID=UPI003F75A3F5
MVDIVVAPASLLLMMVAVVLAAVLQHSKSLRARPSRVTKFGQDSKTDAEVAMLPKAPGPKGLPIFGNLHQLAKYKENPFEGFTIMAKEFGDVFSLSMGTIPCLIISSFENIKEVLIKKGNLFDGRPDFFRWNAYFNGNRQLSLALCDWTNVQKTRRNIARSFLLFRQESPRFDALESTITSEMVTFMEAIDAKVNQEFKPKTLVSFCAMNIFTRYMCSTTFDYSDSKFVECVSLFDQIFEDINNGHVTDFLPWMSPFFKSYSQNIEDTCAKIRNFLLEHIIKDRTQTVDSNQINDLVDALLCNFKSENQDENLNLDWQNVLFELEDLLGGSSAISNMVIRTLFFTALNPRVVKLIQQELDENLGSNNPPTMSDRPQLKFLEATILEVLRHTSSPIVPHLASEDTSIGGYSVDKGTVVFLNNYDLNMSPSLWNQPEDFCPERFLVNNQIKKPAHFIPFSTGKRSCIGSKLLMNVIIVTIGNILQKYDITIPNIENVVLSKGRIAVEGDGFDICLTPRA